MTVRLVDDGELLVNRTVRGSFGVPLVIEQPGVVKVEMTIPRPVNGVPQPVLFRYSLERGSGTPALEHAGAYAFPLLDTEVDRCVGANATDYVPDTQRFLCVMPRLAYPKSRARPRPAAQWPAITLANLAKLRAVIDDAHPGPHLDDDPAFAKWMNDGYEEARALALDVRNEVQSAGVLAYFVAGFRDGHLQFGVPADTVLWAGFVPELRNDKLVVSYVRPHWPVALPPIGADVVSCDGTPVADLMTEIGRYYDRRMELESVRADGAFRLTLDAGRIPTRKPWRQCTFVTAGGQRRTLPLHWRLYAADLIPNVAFRAASVARAAAFELDDLGAGRYWVRVPTFTAHGERYEQVVALAKRLESLPDPKLVVFDLRGNNGGSSSIGSMLLEALAGDLDLTEEQLAGAPPFYALWRVSETNLRSLEERAVEIERQSGPEHPSLLFVREYAARMKVALAAGEPWVKQEQSPMPTRELVARAGAKAKRYTGAMAVVTDGACASACLDFMDVILAYPGVVHLGRTTSADTRYLEVASYEVADQLRVGVPRKAWFGRPRGNNEPYVPSRIYPGDIHDDAAVRDWTLSQLGAH